MIQFRGYKKESLHMIALLARKKGRLAAGAGDPVTN